MGLSGSSTASTERERLLDRVDASRVSSVRRRSGASRLLERCTSGRGTADGCGKYDGRLPTLVIWLPVNPTGDGAKLLGRGTILLVKGVVDPEVGGGVDLRGSRGSGRGLWTLGLLGDGATMYV